jgi:hypothetical protein
VLIISTADVAADGAAMLAAAGALAWDAGVVGACVAPLLHAPAKTAAVAANASHRRVI